MTTVKKMSAEDLLDHISEMSVLEVSKLVKLMEEKFGVSAAAPVAAVAAAPAEADQLLRRLNLKLCYQASVIKRLTLLKQSVQLQVLH